MKIISAEQMQQIDKDAIQGHGIPGLLLMERAGERCAEFLQAEFSAETSKVALVVAGKGNNGGDGYVVARILHTNGWNVSVIVLASHDKISGDAAVNLGLLPQAVGLTFFTDDRSLGLHLKSQAESTVIVDAIFGTGLKNEVTGIYRQAIEAVNRSGRPVLSVDIPSGVNGSTGEILGAAVKANFTVTFACAKLGHVLYPGAAYVGSLKVTDIGIPAEIIERERGCEFVNAAEARCILRYRDPSTHKGSFGHCLIIAGSTGHTGAAALAAAGALRGGAGLVTLAVPASLNAIFEIKTTEVMTLPLPDGGEGYLGDDAFTDISAALVSRNVIALGPGISRQQKSAKLVLRLVREINLPMVIDADGLNAISEDCSVLLEKASPAMILTPHPGEMARLVGLTVSQVEADRIGVASRFAQQYRVYMVLKGARSVIASPDGEISINGSGNPGMATGGMGDVLTGLISALLCQGYPPFDACRLGVFVHGYSADLVAKDKGEIGMTATDVVERLPYAYNQLMKIEK